MTQSSSVTRWIEDLPIVKKGLLLMLLPLFFQVLTMVAFTLLYNRILVSRHWYVHSTRVVENVDSLRAATNEVYYNSVLAVFVPEDEVERDKRFSRDESLLLVKTLRDRVTDNQPQLQRVTELIAKLDRFIAMIDGLDSVLENPTGPSEHGSASRGQQLRKLLKESLEVKDSIDTDIRNVRAVEMGLQEQRKAEVDSAIWRAGIFVSIGFVMVSALTMYLFVLFRRAIATRLNTVSGNLQRLELSEGLAPPIGGRDEIARLDQAIHSLATALSAKALETEVFLYSVSHDLRSPLVNLSGFTDELRLSAADLKEVLDRYQAAHPQAVQDLAPAFSLIEKDFERSFVFLRTAVTRLSKIIDALLKLSRVGRVQYRNEPVDLEEVINRVIVSLANSVQHADAEIKVGALPKVFGDETAYEQIFGNLLSNALTYRDPSRKAVVTVTGVERAELPNLATVVVEDNGFGMSAGAAKKLFLAFQRFRPEIGGGEGIGLAIVRRVVSSLGGKIWCETEEGVGSKFFVAMPRTAEQRVAVPDAIIGL